MFTGVRLRGYRSFDDSGTLPLSAITVVVGRNNTGKSTLLRAIYQVQSGAPWSETDIRFGHSEAVIDLDYDDLDIPLFNDRALAEEWASGRITVTQAPKKPPTASLIEPGGSRESRAFSILGADEPENLIYPTLSGRRVWSSEEQVRREATSAVTFMENNLVSRASVVIAPRTVDGREFEQLCLRVLGMTVDLMTGANGQRLGRAIDRRRTIGLDAMGTGVGAVIGLLVNLAGAHRKVFLIEEPENDLHPTALKALLDVIAEKSVDNQFVVSTHSGIVLTRLGSVAGATVLETRAPPPEVGQLPTSTISRVEGRDGRLGVLRDLGYGLADLSVGVGWLVFEESTAERLCRQYLIPWFVPELTTLNTVAADGTSRIATLTRNLHDMTLYAHLEPAYRERLWVVADGDEAGIDAVNALKATFVNWPRERFLTWDEPQLERYYPARFAERVDALARLGHNARRGPKRELFNTVLRWIASDERQARFEFTDSAAGMIAVLRDVARQLKAETEPG